MNNLKRILSLALASVMVLGMMVVGASATDYVDDDKIVNKTAVETLAALGIMNGDDRGFRPGDGLTRAEAAKMLAAIHNNGVDVDYGVKDTPTFKDIKGHWAEAKIEYAAAFGIVNGKGDIFDPQGELRVVELARMTLNMLGVTEGVTGADWELKTTVAATNAGLFKGLKPTPLPSANVTRDQAAQILYNALYVKMDETYTGDVTSTVNVYKVVLTETGDKIPSAKAAKVHEMSFTSAAEATVIAQSFGLTAGEASNGYTIQSKPVTTTTKGPVKETLAHKYLSLNSKAGILQSVKLETSGQTKGLYKVTTSAGAYYTRTDTSSNMIGEAVQVLYKSATSVYGILPIGDVVYEGTVGGLTAAVLGMDKDNADILKATSAGEWNNTAAEEVDWKAANKSYGVKVALVDETDDGDPVYTVTLIPAKAATVTNVTATTIVVTPGVGSKVIDKEIKGYEGIAKNDKVIVTEAANTVSGMVELAKAETLNGVAADAARTSSKEIRIEGTWYPALDGAYTELAKMTPNNTYDLVLVNGYVVSQTAAQTAASTDLLILLKVADNVTGLNDYKEARAYFVADGTTQIIKLSQATADAAVETENVLLTYTVNNNGYYVTKALGDSTLGYDTAKASATVTAATTSATARIDGKLIADDAKIIVMYNKGNKGVVVEAVDAKTARTWSWTTGFTGFGSTGNSFANNVNGVPYVKFAFINASSEQSLPGQTGATGNYGYVVSAPYLTTSNGVRYSVYDIWTGAETITVMDQETGAPALQKGQFVAYADLGNGIIDTTFDTVTTANRVLGTAAAVTGLSTTDGVIYLQSADKTFPNGTALTLDSKTVVFYVDTIKTEGVATGTLNLATEVNGSYTPNVKAVLSSDKKHVDILIVDVANAIAGEPVLAPVVNAIADSAAMKALDNGVYNFTGTSLSGIGINDLDAAGQNILFKYTFPGTVTGKITFTISKADGTKLYIESITPSALDTTKTYSHCFVINADSIGSNSEAGGSMTAGQALEAGNYNATITSDSDGVLLSVTFGVQ